ncbi:hypothetical protein M5K25_014029 [Dendrobium thyrsiflorum]|uniref:Uncharacterized protein n=1 Tax=Dendrobium thyrsiflorum TaxID=117978 RepID=A0ABD0UUN6_DENTH
MASESSVADQSIDEHAEEEKVGDVSKCVDGEEIIFQPKEAAGIDEAENNKEVGSTGMASTAGFSEENLEPDDLSVSDITKKEEQHEKVGEVENSEVSNSSEPVVEIDEGTLQREVDDAREMPSELQEKSSDFIETSASQEPVISESKSEDLKDSESKPTFENEGKSEEAPLVSTGVDISEDENIVAETQEAANPAFSMDKTGIELIGSEDSNDEIHVLVPAEIPAVFVPDSSETPEKNVDSTNLASIEVPVKDLEAVSGSPEEQKSKESTEIIEPISNVSINDAGDEVVGSSSYEVKPTGVSEVVENKDDGLRVETTQPSFKIQEDLDANYKLAQSESDENVSQGVEVKKDDEIVEGGIETSTVPDDVPPLAIVSSEEEKASEPGVVVEEGESSLESDSIDAVPKVAEISLEGGNVVEEDELVDKERIVTADAVERDLVDSITDPTEANVSSDQVRTPITENVNEALEVTSQELNIAPVASEAFSEGDQIPAGEEKSDSLKGEVATSVETPNDITTPEEPLDQLIEEMKSESSVSETHSPSEDKLLDEEKDANEEAEDINLQSHADQTPSAVQSDFAEKSASQEPAFSKSEIEDLKDTEIKPTTENERKSEEAHLISTGVGISEAENVEAEPAVVFNKEEETSLEDDNIGTVSKVAEVSLEGEEKSDSLKGEVATSVETPNDITTPEEPLDQVIEEKKSESSVSETHSPSEDKLLDEEKDANEEAEDINLQSQANGADQTPSAMQSDFAEKSASQEPAFSKSKIEDLKDTEIKPTTENERKSEEAHLISTGVGISEDENIEAEPAVVFKKEEETSLEDDNIGTVSKVAEVSLEGGNILEGDKLVDKEEVNADAVERDLFNTIIDPAEAELSFDQVKVPTTAESENEALEVTSKEVNIAPEASDVPFEGDKISTGDEKSEGLKGETSTSMEAPNGITNVEELLDQVIEEKKSESSISYTQPPSEDTLLDEEKDANEEAEDINLQSADQTPSAVQSDFAEKSTSQEPAFSKSKIEDLKDTEIKTTTENERKPEEAHLISTGVGISEDENIEAEPAVVFKKEEETSLEDDNIVTVSKVAEVSLEGGNILEGDKLVDKEEVNTDAIERDLFNTIIDPAEAELSFDQVKAPTTAESENEALEVTSKEVNIAPEASDVPSEGEKISTGDEKSEGLKGETSTSMEAPNDITNVEEPLDQVIEEKKSEKSISDTQPPSENKLVDKEKYVNEEDKEINLQNQADGADQNLSVVQSDFAETSTLQEPVFSESKNEDLKDIETQPTSENERKLVEAPLASTGMDISEDGNLEAESQEATNSEFSKDKVGMELIKSEDSKDEIQVLVPHEIPTVIAPDAFEAQEKNDVDSTYPTSIVVPMKDLEVEFGSPEEQKLKEGTEIKEPSSSASTIDAGVEVVGSSYEAKPSGNAVVERKDDGLEIHENPEANPELAQTQSDENVSEGLEVKKDDEIVEGAIETSNVSDDAPPLAKVSYEEEKAVEPGIVVEEDKTSLEGDNIGTVADVSLKGANDLEGDKLVDKEKVVNSDAVETDLVGTFTDPTDAEVSSDQVKAPTTTEIVKEESNEGALEMTSKELNIAPEASEFPSKIDTFSAGDEEKSEGLIVGDATSVEVPKDIIVVKESLDQLVEEKKSESLASEMAAQTEDKLVDQEKNVNVKDEERELINTSTDATAAEVSSEKVKAPELVEEESNKQALEETSKELNIAPEASEVTYEDEKLFAGEEKSGSLKGEAATSVEAPEDIITIKESHDQAIEEEKSETEAQAEDKLIDKEKKVNEKAEERELVDTSIDPTAAEVSSDQTKAYETVEITKEESNEQALEVTSKDLDIASEAAEVSFIGDEVSAGDEVKSESSKEDTPDQVIMQKKSEGSKSEMEALAEDKLVEKEKDMNAEAEKTESVDIPTDPSAAEVFSEQVKVAETAEIVNESDKEALELASSELNIVPEASEVPSEGDKVSLGEGEKSKSLKGEDAASLEARKDITTQEKSVDQLIEENKNESSKNMIEAPIETTRDFDAPILLPKAVKDVIASEAAQEKQDETSNDLSLEEKKASDSYKKEEVKVEEALQHATDQPGQAELSTEKSESEKSKDENPIVSSDTGEAKLTKEVTKRESNIFSKVKRSIVKAKKAILGKSPGPKTLSSEAKDEKNI